MHRGLPTGPDLELGLAGLTIAVIFSAALILPVPFWRAQPAAPGASGPPSTTGLGWPAMLLAVGFALALCLPFRPYVLAMRCAASTSWRTLLLVTIGLALVALLIYPAFGSDLFVYADYERMWTVYGTNPLLAVPDLHPEDWAYRYVWIPGQPNPYGPLWAVLTWPIARLAGTDLWAWITGYKLAALAGYVGSSCLVWMCADADRRARSLVLFAWNPLVLFEVLGKAHNDSLLALSALATVWLARRHPASGLLAATAGAMVKLSGAAIGLGLVVALARARAWRPLGLGLAVSSCVGIALFAPFWEGPSTLKPVFVQAGFVVWSPGALLIAAFGTLLPNADLVIRLVCVAAWVGVCVVVARRGTLESLATDTVVLLLATLLLLTTAFFAHYLVPVIALTAVAGNRRLERLVMTLSIGSLAAYAVELFGASLPGTWIGSPGYQALGSIITLAPSLAAFARCRVSRA